MPFNLLHSPIKWTLWKPGIIPEACTSAMTAQQLNMPGHGWLQQKLLYSPSLKMVLATTLLSTLLASNGTTHSIVLLLNPHSHCNETLWICLNSSTNHLEAEFWSILPSSSFREIHQWSQRWLILYLNSLKTPCMWRHKRKERKLFFARKNVRVSSVSL